MIKHFAMATALTVLASLSHAFTVQEYGNINLDASTGLEWLDLTETAGQSYDEVVAKLAVGGSLEGWRYATAEELERLLISFDIDRAADMAVNASAAQTFVAVMGDLSLHASYQPDHPFALGFLEPVSRDFYAGDQLLWSEVDYQLGIVWASGAVEVPWYYDNYVRTPLEGAAGSFLVRTAQTSVTPVPLPASLPMLTVGLALIIFSRRRLGR